MRVYGGTALMHDDEYLPTLTPYAPECLANALLSLQGELFDNVKHL